MDRKKNIFKLAQGEYVAVEKVESVYTESYFVNQIFVYGDSLKANLVGVVVPDEQYVKKYWYKENGVEEGTPFEQVARMEKFNKDILEDMNAVAKKKGVSSHTATRLRESDPDLHRAEDVDP